LKEQRAEVAVHKNGSSDCDMTAAPEHARVPARRQGWVVTDNGTKGKAQEVTTMVGVKNCVNERRSAEIEGPPKKRSSLGGSELVL